MLITQWLKYLILFFILCNITGYSLLFFGSTAGSVASGVTFLLPIIFFFLVKPWHKVATPFLVFGFLFFAISGLNYSEVDYNNNFVKQFIRYLIVAVCGWEVVHRTKLKDIYFVVLCGAMSIIITAIFFPKSNIEHGLIAGRFSGFYLNPNAAGVACLMGFAISFYIPSKLWKYVGQFVFTLGGIFTLSKTFIAVWLVINLFAIIRSKKNIIVPIIGALVLVVVFNFTDTSIFASSRFTALESFFGDGPVATKTIKEGSRDETWALYYDLIFEKPLFGHGFMEFQKRSSIGPGAHNTYLMVIGEAGIIPFLLFIGIYAYLMAKSLLYFKKSPELLYMTLVLVLALLVRHNYFYNFFDLLLSMYVYLQLRKLSESENESFSSSE